MNRLAVGLAVGAGYVLGRTKKAKFAFAVGSMVAGKKLHLSPKALGALVNQQLQNNPQFKEIGDQLRQDLRGVGKAATGSLVNRQLEGLADRLHDRTQGVQDRLSGVVPDEAEDTAKSAAKGAKSAKGKISGRDEREEDEGRAEREEAEGEGEEQADAEESERPQRRRKAPAKKTSASKPAAKSAAKTAAKKPPAKRSQGAKSAQSGTRKKTAAARGAARGTASSARTGGGRTKGDRDHG
ncbi:DNA primase [Streptomyces formicae]